jgi:superfamily II DNA or RNA helicase
MNKLLDYQKPHTQNIIQIIKRSYRALDSSATGTGKSYTSIVVALELNLKPFIICPKSMEHIWKQLLKEFNCPYFGISSYELIRNGFYMDHKSKRQKLNFMEIKDNEYIINDIDRDILIIYDEAHKCKNIHTLNGKILLEMAKQDDAKILLLSATIADKPIYAILLGFVLKLFVNIEQGKEWISKNVKKHKNYMLGIRDVIFPKYGSRMDISEIIELCPENRVMAECYEAINENEIEKEYENIKFYVNNLNPSMSGIGFIIKSRQRIELLKIPDFVHLTKYHLERGKSITIFVNYTETIRQLSKMLDTKCIIYGEQDIRTREKNIRDFNEDKERVIICNIRTGGTGISLHDLNGNFPRVSLISPTWSATDLMQALGRIFRSGVLTPCEQYIIFSNCKNERYIQNNIKNKINNIGLLNEGESLIDNPIFKIENLIEKYIDSKTEFGETIVAKKSMKQKKLEKINALNEEKRRQELYKKEILPFESMDIIAITNIMKKLEIKKSNILMLDDSEEKTKLLDEVNQEINKRVAYIQKTF